MKIILTFNESEDRDQLTEVLDGAFHELHDDCSALDDLDPSVWESSIGYVGEGYYNLIGGAYVLVALIKYED